VPDENLRHADTYDAIPVFVKSLHDLCSCIFTEGKINFFYFFNFMLKMGEGLFCNCTLC